MGKIYRKHLAGLGLTYPQYLVMLVLWEADGTTVTALGECLYLDSATLTPLLKRLQTMGLLRRDRAADDQRQVRVTLTPAGRDLRLRAGDVPKGVLCATGCSPDHARVLKAELEELRAHLRDGGQACNHQQHQQKVRGCAVAGKVAQDTGAAGGKATHRSNFPSGFRCARPSALAPLLPTIG